MMPAVLFLLLLTTLLLLSNAYVESSEAMYEKPFELRYMQHMYVNVSGSGISFKYKNDHIYNIRSKFIGEQDTLTHVNGIPVISAADIATVFANKFHEVIIPIVDDEDLLDPSQEDSPLKLKGFVSMKILDPNSLNTFTMRKYGSSEPVVVLASVNAERDVVTSEAEIQKSKQLSEQEQIDHTKEESLHKAAKATVTATAEAATNTAAVNEAAAKEAAIKAAAVNEAAAKEAAAKAAAVNEAAAKEAAAKAAAVNEAAAKEAAAKAAASNPGDSEEHNQQLDPMEALYGMNRPYPLPYDAGRMPRDEVQRKLQSMAMSQPYLYAVRFRSGPLGLSFDNKLTDQTKIERVQGGQISDQSGILAGDFVVAINEHNVSDLSAAKTLKVLSLVSFPKVIVFESRYMASTADSIKESVIARSYNLEIIYPPGLMMNMSIRLAEWSSPFLFSREDRCPVLRFKGGIDTFGCEMNETEFVLSPLQQSISNGEDLNLVETADDGESTTLKLLHVLTLRKNINIEIISSAVVKRGVCTFVDKARSLAKAGAQLAVVVNTEKELIDLPTGKENIEDLSMYIGAIGSGEGQMLLLAGAPWRSVQGNVVSSFLANITAAEDVLAVITSLNKPHSNACALVRTAVRDIVDASPRSNLPAATVIQRIDERSTVQLKQRTANDKGGRVALAGSNGWVYFDYLEALFGTKAMEKLTMSSHNFKMAEPVFGCDQGKYTVRIVDFVVGILRGGGCSFGIKVINAQKLGAKAIMVINNDDSPISRIMVSKDEAALITVPCFMVANRALKYLTSEAIKPYYANDAFILSIQPLDYFADYEKHII